MQPTLDERKQMLVDECLLEYMDQPRKWWQFSPAITYKSTWDCYKEHNYPRVYVDEINIPRNKDEAYYNLILAVLFGLIFFIITIINAGLFLQVLTFGGFGTLLYFIIKNLKDDKPRITFTKEGLWTSGWGYTIPWADIVVSCMRMDSSGEGIDYFLRIHFYDPYEDDFKMAEYNVNMLEKEPDTIACFVQQFRMDFGKQDKNQSAVSITEAEPAR